MVDPRDDRGAILLMGVFMGAFMAGALFYVVALGEAVLHRERLQDAADVTALSGAIIQARAMNLVVLLNQLMATLLAVLVAVRLVEMLATLAMILVLAASFLAPGAAAALGPLENVRSGAGRARERLDRPVHDALRAINGAARAVRSAAPALAAVQALRVSTGGVDVAVAVPASLTLPLEDDAFEVLCGRATGQAVGFALSPFDIAGLGGVVGELRGAARDLAEGSTEWFCGKGGGRPPTLRRTVERVLPTVGARADCERALTRGPPSAACAEMAREEELATPDASGECQGECGRTGPYRVRAKAARAACEPKAGRSLTGFSWQERGVRVELTREGRLGWRPTGRREPLEPRLVAEGNPSRRHPCGSDSAVHSPRYEQDPERPVCESPVEVPPPSGARTWVAITEVLQVFGCIAKEQVEIAGKGEPFAGSDDEAPQRVARGVAQGTERMQVRGLVLGHEAPSLGLGALRVATWGREERPGGLGGSLGSEAIAWLGRLGVAQAEMFFDGVAPREDWMWQRRWTARLTRLSAPTGEPSQGLCEGASVAELCQRPDLWSRLFSLSSH